MIVLTEENFLKHAMNHYDKASVVSIEEFENDLSRFKYLKKLFNRYHTNNDLNDRLILNHIIILYNVFGDMATNMLLYKIPKQQWPALLSFIVYLDRLPDYVVEYNLRAEEVTLDLNIINRLKLI